MVLCWAVREAILPSAQGSRTASEPAPAPWQGGSARRPICRLGVAPPRCSGGPACTPRGFAEGEPTRRSGPLRSRGGSGSWARISPIRRRACFQSRAQQPQRQRSGSGGRQGSGVTIPDLDSKTSMKARDSTVSPTCFCSTRECRLTAYRNRLLPLHASSPETLCV